MKQSQTHSKALAARKALKVHMLPSLLLGLTLACVLYFALLNWHVDSRNECDHMPTETGEGIIIASCVAVEPVGE